MTASRNWIRALRSGTQVPETVQTRWQTRGLPYLNMTMVPSGLNAGKLLCWSICTKFGSSPNTDPEIEWTWQIKKTQNNMSSTDLPLFHRMYAWTSKSSACSRSCVRHTTQITKGHPQLFSTTDPHFSCIFSRHIVYSTRNGNELCVNEGTPRSPWTHQQMKGAEHSLTYPITRIIHPFTYSSIFSLLRRITKSPIGWLIHPFIEIPIIFVIHSLVLNSSVHSPTHPSTIRPIAWSQVACAASTETPT